MSVILKQDIYLSTKTGECVDEAFTGDKSLFGRKGNQISDDRAREMASAGLKNGAISGSAPAPAPDPNEPPVRGSADNRTVAETARDTIEKMTVKEIKVLLDANDVEYEKKARKDDLVELAFGEWEAAQEEAEEESEE